MAGAALHDPGCSILPAWGSKLTSRTWRKDSSGAEQLRRRSLDNYGHLGAPGPISLSSPSLSLSFPPVVYTAALHWFLWVFFFSSSSFR